ncbi:DUF4240 domain-containing protein [Nonomuraea sp. NPDC050536]|uniref:DUF4240 domain-containing protein n=1 Tax=Nonomuraea sp. NPDC050536 TaxID=3364366 RepID=UPI0037C69D4B
MELDGFWDSIEASRSTAGEHGQEAQIDWLTAYLAATSLEHIRAFHRHWRTAMDQAYSWDLWGAAYVRTGFCSDDGFEYFRAWLILQGRQNFERAVQDPDCLGELDPSLDERPWQSAELALGITRDAYRRFSGTDAPDGIEELYELALALHPRGQIWPTQIEEFQQHWPRLWTRFGQHRDWVTPPQASNQGHPGLSNLVLPHNMP